MIKLIGKTKKAQQKLDHHGDMVEVQNLNQADNIGFQIGEFKGEPAILVRHQTDHLRWVMLDLKDPEFNVDLDPESDEEWNLGEAV